jgi:hypothetical protein
MPSNQEALETGTTSALDRMDLTARLTDMLVPFLEDHEFRLSDFGQHVILRDNGSLVARIRRRVSKKSDEVLMVKFAPDYVCTYKDRPENLFLLDAKASITPVIFGAQIDKISIAAKLPHLERQDIGEVEREAWDVYNRFYPKDRVAICFASPYHPRLLVAEWVSNIKPLYRLEVDVNTEAGGSGTPHVNIHLKRMRTLEEFLDQNFGVKVDQAGYKAILDFIKTWGLNKPRGRVNWKQFNNVVRSLQRVCPWLQERWLDGRGPAPIPPLMVEPTGVKPPILPAAASKTKRS